MPAKGLTLKERRFVDAYLGSCKGNGTAAAIAAGYSRRSARRMATRLVSTKAHIRAAIETRNQKAEAKGIAAADERDQVLSDILRTKAAEPSTRIAAIKELNKCSGRHSIKHVMDVTEKLSDIIAASRRPA